jgi:hypothetical protein
MQTCSIPSICLRPTGNLQGSYYFFSLVTGKAIKQRNWDELPVPQSVIDCVAFFAKSSSPPDLIFANCHCQPYAWPDEIIVGSDDPQSAPYHDLNTNIPGVHIGCQDDVPPQSFSPSSDNPDWAQMADNALANAAIDDMDVLPPPPEVIMIDDDDNIPLPPSIKQSLDYLPKNEPANSAQIPPLPASPPARRNPPHNCVLPSHLSDYHPFTAVADDVHASYPYANAKGHTVDLAFEDEQCIVQVCHYVMLHCTELMFIGNPNNKKQYGLKAALKNC